MVGLVVSKRAGQSCKLFVNTSDPTVLSEASHQPSVWASKHEDASSAGATSLQVGLATHDAANSWVWASFRVVMQMDGAVGATARNGAPLRAGSWMTGTAQVRPARWLAMPLGCCALHMAAQSGLQLALGSCISRLCLHVACVRCLPL